MAADAQMDLPARLHSAGDDHLFQEVHQQGAAAAAALPGAVRHVRAALSRRAVSANSGSQVGSSPFLKTLTI